MQGLTPIQRQQDQQRAVLCNLLVGVGGYIMPGVMLTLYANDVLYLSPLKIASIASFIPFLLFFKFLLIGFVKRLGLIRATILSVLIRIAVILTLMALPAAKVTYPLFLALVLLFVVSAQAGSSTVWQPFLKRITTTADRGSFLAKMRFSYSAIAAIGIGVISFFIGKDVSETQYKIMLIFVIISLLNYAYWISKTHRLSAAQNGQGDPAQRKSTLAMILHVIRHSELLRRPLVIALIISACHIPLLIIYLRQVMYIPSNILSIYMFILMLGTILSFLLWGKVADAIGFRPMLIGLLFLFMITTPLILFIAPLAENAENWQSLSPRGLFTIGVLFLMGFTSGVIDAGIGITITSIQYYHVRDEHAVEALNVFSFAMVVAVSCISLFSGFLLQKIAIPAGTHPVLAGVIYLDWFKAYFVLVLPVLLLICIKQVRQLPNPMPHRGLRDFTTYLLSKSNWGNLRSAFSLFRR